MRKDPIAERRAEIHEAAESARYYARARRENPTMKHTCVCGRELPEDYGYQGSRLCGDKTCDERMLELQEKSSK